MQTERSPEPRKVLKLFDDLVSKESFLAGLRPPGPAFCRTRIYTLAVVVRLMLLQRVFAELTLASAVQLFRQRMQQFGPGNDHHISAQASAYCRARKKLPTLVARQVLELICKRLCGWLPDNPVLPGRTVYVCDGSTLRLPHSAALARAYPPHGNQSGSHWPFLRLVVLQDVQTGLAVVPEWGPETESEQALALRAILHLPTGAVVIGDRNFGVFGVALAAHRWGHDVIVRLTKVRAERLAGKEVPLGADCQLIWKPSRWDTCGAPYESGAGVHGRLVCIPATELSREPVYLFTTLNLPAKQIGDLYALRWNVETDLRSIKQTVRLQQLSARSVNGLHNELLFAFAAYNLVRAVICLAAQRANVPPRRISFTNVYTLLRIYSPDIHAHSEADPSHPVWDQIIDTATYYKLPNRSKKRSYPRAVWPKADPFPVKRLP